MNDVAFRRAAATGDLSTVQRLVDEEAINVNCAGRNGVTALHKAAEHSQISIIRFLARRGIDLNTVGGVLGGTPLHHAAYWGQPRAIQQLLRLGANPLKLDSQGKTALEIARERGQTAIVALLVNSESDVVKSKSTENCNPTENDGSALVSEKTEAESSELPEDNTEKPVEETKTTLEIEEAEATESFELPDEVEVETEKSEVETYVANEIEAEKRTVKEEVDTVVVNTEVSTLMVKIRGPSVAEVPEQSVPSHNRQKEMKKEKSVQIARPARKPSTESEVDPLLAQIQEKSAKAEQKPEVPKKPDQVTIKKVLSAEKMANGKVKVELGASQKLANEIRRQQAQGGRAKQINNLISLFENEHTEPNEEFRKPVLPPRHITSVRSRMASFENELDEKENEKENRNDEEKLDFSDSGLESSDSRAPSDRTIKDQVTENVQLLKSLQKIEPKTEKPESDTEILPSPTEEALEDLLSIIPQLHDGKGDLSAMIFSEANRHKWDYVAEIFVDLQDLNSNRDIPLIIDEINDLKEGDKVGQLLQRITNVIAKIQGEENLSIDESKTEAVYSYFL